jgi:hypothetical protein
MESSYVMERNWMKILNTLKINCNTYVSS